MHTVLVTGASSGIGADMARVLVEKGHKVILVARREERLKKLVYELGGSAEYIVCDVSVRENCFWLYDQTKDKNIDVLINNAGFGLLGEFAQTPPERELEMIDTNLVAVHILTKLFLKDFLTENKGYIMNVASSAAFAPGPLLATYYATKAYVLRLTRGIKEELKQKGKKVCVSALCPGPVKTEFDSVAKAKKSLGGVDGRYVAEKAVKGMFEGKSVIIPGVKNKIACFGAKLLPECITAKITYRAQRKKLG